MSARRRRERVHRSLRRPALSEQVQATADRCAALEQCCCAPVTRSPGVEPRALEVSSVEHERSARWIVEVEIAR
jgi:hypothetical protein